MVMKAILKSLDDLPEALHEHYAEQDDGTFRLDVESVGDFELVNMKNVRHTTRRLHELKERYKVGEDGEYLDPKAALEAMQRVTELEALGEDAEARVQEKLEAHKRKLTDDFTSKLTAKDTEIAGLIKDLEKREIDQTVDKVMAEKKCPAVLRKEVRSRVEMKRQADGSWSKRFLDEDGMESPTIDSLGDLVDHVKTKFADQVVFPDAPSGSGGSGSSGGSGGAKTVRSSDQDALGSSLEDIASGKVTVVD